MQGFAAVAPFRPTLRAARVLLLGKGEATTALFIRPSRWPPGLIFTPSGL